jgi:hypothetical protein
MLPFLVRHVAPSAGTGKLDQVVNPGKIDACAPIVAGDDDARVVRAPCRVIDSPGVLAEGEELLAGLGILHFGAPIFAGSDDAGVI